MRKNSCYTYFRITGGFEPNSITEKLGLQPNNFWTIGDKRPDGTSYDFSAWEFGRCDNYDVIAENQMHTTISELLDKVDLLNEIRQQFDVDFTLEIVPTVYAENPAPCLAPSMTVIDFCYVTRTQIDIDLYVMRK